MIRFFQQDSRFIKAIFIVFIGMISISMVVYLIPGLMGGAGVSDDTYAIVYPHWYSKYLASGSKVTQERVSQLVNQQLQRQGPQAASSPFLVQFFTERVAQQLIQQQVELAEADKLGIHASEADVIAFLHKGQFGQVLFPDGKFIGEDKYTDFVANQFHMPVPDFEDLVRKSIQGERLRSLITAGVTVSDDEIKADYKKHNTKIKFDYAVISGDSLRGSINPSDNELLAFFKSSATRYATAVPETRSISYFAFTIEQLPGGLPKVSQQEIQQYYDAHKDQYKLPKQSRARHILIKVDAKADAKTDAAAKAKAEGILKQIQGGGNFADLAKKNSDDPGSKDSGGELGFAKPGMMVPEFDKAIFSQKIGDTAIVKTQFGYHIVQVEERQDERLQPLNEVLPTIQITLIRQKIQKAEEQYAQTLAAEAQKNGLEKTAKAHGLELQTTEQIPARGTIAALPNSTKIVSAAFEAKQGDAPQFAETGEGYAIYQVASITKAHAPDFNVYKAQILNDYRNDKLPTLLAAKTNELAAKAKSLGDLAKAAKELNATVKTSDLVAESGQVPDLGAVSEDLFKLNIGEISGPITASRNGVVAKILEKQEPAADEIAKNLDQNREQVLDQRRADVYNLYISNQVDQYKKNKRILLSARAQQQAADSKSKLPKL